MVCPITSDINDYAKEVVDKLRATGFRIEGDYRNEKIGYKVREHTNARVPVLLSVGHREKDDGTVSVRRIGSKDNTVKSLDELIKDLQSEIDNKVAYDKGE